MIGFFDNFAVMRVFSLLGLVALVTVLLQGCFQTHPYDTDFGGETDINRHHIIEIESACAAKSSVKVAVISDSHCWYSDLRDAVSDINAKGDVDFVVHCGDLSDTGTTKEFVWAREELDELKPPYVALIGNHDFLGTGEAVYEAMFGEVDFSFIAARVKFVALNTNATEYDYMAAVPNFDFMENEMTKDREKFDRTIVLMHAPPYSDQFNNNVVKSFQRYVRFFPEIMFCVAGHCHEQSVTDLYNDGLLYFGVDCISHRNYYLFTITPEGYSYELVVF